MLGAPWDVIEAHVREVVRRGAAAPAHIVNLGHGVPPHADPEVLTRIVELVHSIEQPTIAAPATPAAASPASPVASPADAPATTVETER